MNLTTVIMAIFPLLGVALGAGLQYFFSRSSEERKKLISLRTEAYIDYLVSVAKFAQAAKTNPNERYKLLAEAADAKTRICIYGSIKTVHLLATFERQGARLLSQDSIDTFMRLCLQMRSEGLKFKENISKDDFEIVLFGPEPQKFSVIK